MADTHADLRAVTAVLCPRPWADRKLATSIGAVLLVLGGWPLVFLHFPPYQDLPDHLATACVLLHPDRYPEFVSNGWLKADALFMGVVVLLSKAFGVLAAGRAFAVLVVAATAFALPHFVLSFSDRRRLVAASLGMAPMVHNWWTSMGMLSFAFAFPLSLLALALVARQAQSPTWRRGIGIAMLAILLWFTHAVALLLVGLLTLIETVRDFWARRAVGPRSRSRALGVITPFLPAAGLVVVTIAAHAVRTTREGEYGQVDGVLFQDNASNLYDLWAHWWFGLSPLSAASLVPALVFAWYAARGWKAPVPMFSGWALAALLGLYWFLPYMMPGFGYVNERALPLIWAAALVRVPARIPRSLAVILGAASVLWSIGLGADLFRAERDLDRFVEAAPYVPPGARLLTLNFATRVSSTNTWPLLHASGMYTLLRSARPLDVWADSPSAAIRHARPPAFVEDPVRVRRFVATAATPDAYCAALGDAGPAGSDCRARWEGAWEAFWSAARQDYDWLLLWRAPPELRALVPPEYRLRFSGEWLELRARVP